MNIGDNVVLTEAALVFDNLGHDLLLVGTRGAVTAAHENLISLLTAKGIYDNIPIASVKLAADEDKAA